MPEREGEGQLSLRTGVREAVTATQNHSGRPPLHCDLHIFACICITKSVESALMVPAFEDWQKLKRVGVTGRAWGILEGNREGAVAAMLWRQGEVLGPAKRQFPGESRTILHVPIPCGQQEREQGIQKSGGRRRIWALAQGAALERKAQAQAQAWFWSPQRQVLGKLAAGEGRVWHCVSRWGPPTGPPELSDSVLGRHLVAILGKATPACLLWRSPSAVSRHNAGVYLPSAEEARGGWNVVLQPAA